MLYLQHTFILPHNIMMYVLKMLFSLINIHNCLTWILNKKYNDKHFGYNLWKWSLNKFKSQKDIFTKEERLKIYEMMKQEFNIGRNLQ